MATFRKRSLRLMDMQTEEKMLRKLKQEMEKKMLVGNYRPNGMNSADNFSDQSTLSYVNLNERGLDQHS